jgi:RNA polymerase sigma-70 factor (ECF subfamily)
VGDLPPDPPRGRARDEGGPAEVVALDPFVADQKLLDALRAGDARAKAALFDRHAAHVERVLVRLLGFDTELADVMQDVFVEALGSIHEVREARALKAWLTSIAVFTARRKIRSRVRRSWLRFFAPESLPEPESPHGEGSDEREAVERTYRILDRLAPDERIAFALRLIDGMELTEVARACQVSLATIKRRIARAEEQFRQHAQQDPVLREWVEGGERWATT